MSVLLLEKFDDHPELQPEPIQNTLPDNFDLTLYVEPSMPDPTAARLEGLLRGKLSLARSYMGAGMNDKAKAILAKIVKDHPQSAQAAQAAKLLEAMRSEK